MKKLPAFLLIVLLLSAAAVAATRSTKADISKNLEIFNAVYRALQTSYVDTIDADKSMQTAIAAMLDEIDTYTEYIPENEQEDFLTISTGEYGGIGSFIGTRDGETFISEPRDDSPAKRVGLRPGDVFITIDGDSVGSLTSAEISKRLRGQAGTSVAVTVRRKYGSQAHTDTVLSFVVPREKININPVPYYGVVRGDIGIITLSTFNDKSLEKTREALKALLADKSLKGIVLDLRNNGGGLLESAVGIVGLFVPKGTEVLRTRGRGQANEKVYKTTSKPLAPDIPLAILVNGNSASSAEIVTGALQDLDRAVIVGERSFGKGLVQSTRQIPYDGLIKVTIAKYYIPSGRLIQAIDYSHRNPDGSVARIPDSLTNVWHTRAGREVRDGGGITPDITTVQPEVNRMVYNIVSDNWSFNFANRYAAFHPESPDPHTFEISDTIFNEFKGFIDPEKFKYDRACELVLDQLEKSAKTEGYLNDSVQAQIDALRATLHHDLNHDLNLNRQLISVYLGPEILSRYQGERGRIIQSLKHDADVDSAAIVLHNPARYRSILSGK